MMAKRKILASFIILSSLFLFAGCHGSKGLATYETPEEFDTSRNFEITFWAKNDTNKAQTLVYQKAADDFHKAYPNVTVNIRLYTDYSKIYNDVITNISTNTTPNVCITYPDHIATYMTGENTVVALDDLMDDEKYGLGGFEVAFDGPARNEVIGKFLDECRIGEHYYALPYMRSTEALYINKDLVNKLGYEIPDEVTWDFVWEVSEAAMEKNADRTFKVNGQNVMIPFIYKSTDNMMITYLKQMNAGYSDAAGNIKIFNDTTKDLLYTVSKHVKSGAFSTFKISSYPGNFLNAGQCIFAIDSTAGASWMGSDAPLSDIPDESKVSFETVVTAIPQTGTGDPVMISQGPSVCIFNKEDSQEVLASWLFAQFLLTNDIQTGYAKTEGYVPVTTKARESEEYVDYLSRRGEDNDLYYSVKIDATNLLLSSTDNTFITPVFNGSASLRDAAGQLIESTAKSTRRKETIDEAYMNKLFSDITALYRLDSISTNAGAKADLGPLPKTSVILLSTLAGVWIVIIGIYAIKLVKTNKN